MYAQGESGDPKAITDNAGHLAYYPRHPMIMLWFSTCEVMDPDQQIYLKNVFSTHQLDLPF